jgi:hypothetical protein
LQHRGKLFCLMNQLRVREALLTIDEGNVRCSAVAVHQEEIGQRINHNVHPMIVRNWFNRKQS